MSFSSGQCSMRCATGCCGSFAENSVGNMLMMVRSIFTVLQLSLSALRSGGEAQSKHKEGFDPLNTHSVGTNWLVRYGAGPSFRTVGLGAEVSFSF